MEQHILKALAEMEEATGWEVWVDWVSKNMRLATSPTSPGYSQFKRKMSALASSGLIIRTTAERKMAKATWKLTNAGWESLDEEKAAPEGVNTDEWVKKRFRYPADRVVWKAMMERFKNGELDVVFLPARASDEENRR
jgi:hypothetical protein